MSALSGLQVDRYTLTIDGEPLEHPGDMLVLLHKPCGYTCSKTASEGPLVYDLLPYTWLARKPPIATIGRCEGSFSIARRCSNVEHFVWPGTFDAAVLRRRLVDSASPCMQARQRKQRPVTVDDRVEADSSVHVPEAQHRKTICRDTAKASAS